MKGVKTKVVMEKGRIAQKREVGSCSSDFDTAKIGKGENEIVRRERLEGDPSLGALQLHPLTKMHFEDGICFWFNHDMINMDANG